jgi:hypothetical protein
MITPFIIAIYVSFDKVFYFILFFIFKRKQNLTIIDLFYRTVF